MDEGNGRQLLAFVQFKKEVEAIQLLSDRDSIDLSITNEVLPRISLFRLSSRLFHSRLSLLLSINPSIRMAGPLFTSQCVSRCSRACKNSLSVEQMLIARQWYEMTAEALLPHYLLPVPTMLTPCRIWLYFVNISTCTSSSYTNRPAQHLYTSRRR